jgi:hypothetical protein
MSRARKKPVCPQETMIAFLETLDALDTYTLLGMCIGKCIEDWGPAQSRELIISTFNNLLQTHGAQKA